MKTIIAGSRYIEDMDLLTKAIEQSGYEIEEVVSGGASGVDLLGENWAAMFGIPVMRFPADWEQYGKSAGPMRNAQMAAYADALVAVWDGKSLGTRHMILTMRQCGKPFCYLDLSKETPYSVVKFIPHV